MDCRLVLLFYLLWMIQPLTDERVSLSVYPPIHLSIWYLTGHMAEGPCVTTCGDVLAPVENRAGGGEAGPEQS